MFITFYSYKGGVGRSSALINTAYYLAQTGRDVCLIDFDFEAPGLHKMPCFSNISKKDKRKGGLVDYINDYLTHLNPDILKIEDYLVSTDIDVTNTLVYQDKKKSRLSLLKAGNINKDYSEKLLKINWEELYKDYFGYFLFEILKKDLKERLKFDYIFIDSRTGFNDISSICTIQLPDTVVLIFGLNEQNIEGIGSVYKKIKSKNIIPVISPLNETTISDLDKKITELSRFFKPGTDINAISYSSLLSNKETIIFEHKHKEIISLTNQYIALAERIVSQNNKDKNFLRSNLIQNINDISKNKKLIKDSSYILTLEPYSIDYFHHALLLFKENNFEEARTYINKAIKINKKSFDYLYLEILILSALNEDLEEKIEEFKKLGLNNPQVIDLVMQVYLSKNNFFMARKIIEKDYESNRAILSEIYFKEEEYQKSLDCIINLEENQKNLFNISRIYYQIRKYEKALEYIDKALKSEPENISLISLKVNILKNINKFDECIFLYNKCIEKEPNNPNHYYNLAEFYFEICEEELALNYLKTAIKLSPSTIENYLLFLAINFNLNKKEEVEHTLKHLDYLITTQNRKTKNTPRLIEILVSFNSKDKALFYYELLNNLNIDKSFNKAYSEYNSIRIKRALASTSMFLLKYENAINLFLEKNVIRPYVNEEMYFNVAIAYLNIGSIENAKIYFQKVVNIFENIIQVNSLQLKANYLLCYAITLSYLNRKDDALSKLNDCLSIIDKNKNLKYIFSPEEYKFINKQQFLELCNRILENIKNDTSAINTTILH